MVTTFDIALLPWLLMARQLSTWPSFSPEHGPAQLPSEYLKTFREYGWVGLEFTLSQETVDALQQTSCAGPWADQDFDPKKVPLILSSLVAKTVGEPFRPG